MTDDLLVQKAIDGDDNAFEKIIAEFQPRIYSVCFRLLQSEQDAQDACQDTIIKIYLNINKFHFKSSFATWVYTIARNTAIDNLKKNKYTVSADELNESGFDIPHYDTPESIVIKDYAVLQLSEYINMLSHEHRQCLILKDIDGYSLDDIVQILHIPKGTVKSRLHRAREQLHKIIMDHGGL